GDGRGPGAYLDTDRTPRPGTPQAHANAGAGLASHGDKAGGPAYGEPDAHALREVIRRIVIEELAGGVGGAPGWAEVVRLREPAPAADDVLPGDVDPGEPAAQ